jgi:serine/threonine protein kinase
MNITTLRLSTSTAHASPAHHAEPRMPKRVGPYAVECALGRGAHGVVYRAHHVARPGPPVALKVIEARGCIERHLIEPTILSRFQHPNIVQLLDYYVDGGRLVLALELVEGEDLQSFLRRGQKLGPEHASLFLSQMANVLAHAHAAKVLHRDIKPSNILLDLRWPQPRFVLADFGVARIADSVQTERRRGGTYHFMAPEQLRGRPCEQSDLWALGATTYTLLTGRPPFDGANADELTKAILFASPPPLHREAAKGHDGLVHAIDSLLDKRLESRMASAERLLATLPPPDAQAAAAPTAAPLGESSPVERELRRSYRACAAFAAPFLLFAGACTLWVGPMLSLLGVYRFFVVQQRHGAGEFFFASAPESSNWTKQAHTALAVLIIFAGLIVSMSGVSFTTDVMIHEAGLSRGDAGVVNLFTGLLALVCLGPLTGSIAKTRQLARGLDLLRALQSTALEPNQRLAVLGELVSHHSMDLAIQQRYAEELLALGRPKEAIVEARLMLRKDPYNTPALLLMAHAFFELGHARHCIEICTWYLSFAGYTFEFADLKQRCLALAPDPRGAGHAL